MPHPLSQKYPIPISQLCLVNTDVPPGVGAPPLDSTSDTGEGIFDEGLTENEAGDVNDGMHIMYIVYK